MRCTSCCSPTDRRYIVRFNEVVEQLPAERPFPTTYCWKVCCASSSVCPKSAAGKCLGEVVDGNRIRAARRRAGHAEQLGGDRSICLPNLFRFLRLLGRGISTSTDDGLPVPGKFQLPLHLAEHHRILAALAHTLSRWMRDYLYIPLGGNRVSTVRLVFQPQHGLSAFRYVARRRLEFRHLGRLPRMFLILDRLGLRDALQRLGKVPVNAADLRYRAHRLGVLPLPSLVNAQYGLPGATVQLSGDRYGKVFANHRFWFTLGWAPSSPSWAFSRAVESRPAGGTKIPVAVGAVGTEAGGQPDTGMAVPGKIYASGFNPFIYFKF